MMPIVLKIATAPRARLHRIGGAVRAVLHALPGGGMLDHVRAPDGLQYPLGARARRLMRNARAGG